MQGSFEEEDRKQQTRDCLLHLVRHGQDSILDNFLTDMETIGTPLDLKITDSGGYSLVGIAAKYNRLSTLKILLVHGAPHEQPNRFSGVQPIISAQLNKNAEMESILRDPEAFLSEYQAEEQPSYRLTK